MIYPSAVRCRDSEAIRYCPVYRDRLSIDRCRFYKFVANLEPNRHCANTRLKTTESSPVQKPRPLTFSLATELTETRALRTLRSFALVYSPRSREHRLFNYDTANQMPSSFLFEARKCFQTALLNQRASRRKSATGREVYKIWRLTVDRTKLVTARTRHRV